MTGNASCSPLIAQRRSKTVDSFPGLDLVKMKLSVAYRDVLAQLGCPGTRVVAGATEVATATAWEDATDRAAMCAFAFGRESGSIAVSFDATMIVRIVDVFYGGSGDGDPTPGTLRPADHRMIARIGRLWAGRLPSIWGEAIGHDPEIREVPWAASATRRKSAMILHRFTIEGLGTAPLESCWAYPVDLLNRFPMLADAAPEACERAIDPAWQKRLDRAVMEVSLPVRTIFARPELPFSRLLTLKAGDVIPICLPSTVPITVGGHVFAEGTVGESGGRTAIRISRIAQGYPLDG